MAFVQRDSAGHIIAIAGCPQYELDGTPIAIEEVPDTEAVLWKPTIVPDLLPYQFRAMLALSGKQAALDAYIASLPDPQKTIAQAKLDYSLAFQRDNPLVLAAQQALGLSDAQLDAMWAQAAAIE